MYMKTIPFVMLGPNPHQIKISIKYHQVYYIFLFYIFICFWSVLIAKGLLWRKKMKETVSILLHKYPIFIRLIAYDGPELID